MKKFSPITLVITVLAALVAAANVSAASMSSTGSGSDQMITYTAGAGEQNSMAVWMEDTDITVWETGDDVAVASLPVSCTRYAGGPGYYIQCAVSSVAGIALDVGDQADYVSVEGGYSPHVEVSGGAGGDQIQIGITSGMTASSTVTGGLGADHISTGAGADRINVSGDYSRDTVSCGGGTDHYKADTFASSGIADNINKNCEKSSR